MPRALPGAARVTAALIVLVLGVIGPAGAAAAQGGPGVVIISVPGLTWADVDPAAMPRFTAWLDAAAVASMNTRVADDQTDEDAYLSLGSGQRADAEGATVRRSADGAVVEGFAGLVVRNARSEFGAVPGAFGGAVGIGVTAEDDAVILAAIDRSGRADLDAARPVALVEIAAGSSPAVVDALLAEVFAEVPEGALVMVANPVGGSTTPFGVFAMAGDGVTPGYATSSTTRRDGFVSLVDLAPATLRRLGVDRPTAMIDAEIATIADGASGWERAERLETQERRAADRDSTWIAHTVVYVVLVVIAGFAGLAVAAGRRRVAPPAAVAGLAVVILPTVDLLARGIGSWRLPDAVQVAVIPAVALGVAAALAPWRRHCAAGLLAGAAALYLAVVGADLLLGWELQNDATWGNSSILAATSRFTGIGNLAFGLAAAMCVVVLARLAERPDTPASGHSRPSPRVTPTMVGVVLLFVVLDGAPGWGADVGGVLAGLPALVLVLWVLSGRRVSVRAVIGAGLVGVATLGVFALIDAQRPAEQRTHLTRFVTGLFGGDGARTFRRKLTSNLDIAVASWWWVAIAIAAMWIAYARSPGTREALGRVALRHPVLPRLRIPTLVLTVLTFAVNDSGFAPSALQAVILVAVLVTLVAVEDRPGDVAESSRTPLPPA